MSKVGVVYWSGTGNTEAMANAVAEGAKAAGADVSIMTAGSFSTEMVDEYDALAFGCPAMGDEVLEECEFEPMFENCEGKLAGKAVGLFGSYGWGDGKWMRDWEERCKGKNMNLKSDCVTCEEAPDSDILEKCRNLGKVLAE